MIFSATAVGERPPTSADYTATRQPPAGARSRRLTGLHPAVCTGISSRLAGQPPPAAAGGTCWSSRSRVDRRPSSVALRRWTHAAVRPPSVSPDSTTTSEIPSFHQPHPNSTAIRAFCRRQADSRTDCMSQLATSAARTVSDSSTDCASRTTAARASCVDDNTRLHTAAARASTVASLDRSVSAKNCMRRQLDHDAELSGYSEPGRTWSVDGDDVRLDVVERTSTGRVGTRWRTTEARTGCHRHHRGAEVTERAGLRTGEGGEMSQSVGFRTGLGGKLSERAGMRTGGRQAWPTVSSAERQSCSGRTTQPMQMHARPSLQDWKQSTLEDRAQRIRADQGPAAAVEERDGVGDDVVDGRYWRWIKRHIHLPTAAASRLYRARPTRAQLDRHQPTAASQLLDNKHDATRSDRGKQLDHRRAGGSDRGQLVMNSSQLGHHHLARSHRSSQLGNKHSTRSDRGAQLALQRAGGSDRGRLVMTSSELDGHVAGGSERRRQVVINSQTDPQNVCFSRRAPVSHVTSSSAGLRSRGSASAERVCRTPQSRPSSVRLQLTTTDNNDNLLKVQPHPLTHSWLTAGVQLVSK